MAPTDGRRPGRAAGWAVLVLALGSRALAVGPGDCNNDDRVTIDELVVGAAVTTEALPLERCPFLDFDLDGVATLAELVRAVGAALHGISVVPVRGVVEGFYGPPYSFEQRRDLLRFLPRAGLNTYVYAPKLDPRHREEWREPYPDDFLDHFRDLAALGRETGVRFVYSLAPGQSFDPAGGDTARVEEKLRSLFDVGVRDFCLLFDDIQADAPAADPGVQVELANAVLASLRALDARSTLCFISNYYLGTAEELASDSSPFAFLYPIPSSTYYEAYEAMAPDIPILWTGPRVFSDRITLEEASRFRDFAGRPVWIWDNYPVNDALVAQEMFLGPYVGRDAGLERFVDGILLNPMLQPEASKIPLWTAGRFLALGEDYDPDRAAEQAIDLVGGEGAEDFRAVARHFRSHPLIGDAREAPELADAIDAFFAAGPDASPAALALRFEELSGHARNVATTAAGNPRLAAELREPAEKLAGAADAALLALDLLGRHRSGEAVDTAELDAELAATAEIPWLVCANTPFSPELALLVGQREANRQDVMGDFFARVFAELRR